MKRRTKARIPAVAGAPYGPASVILGACLSFLAFFHRVCPIAIRTVAAAALLSAQISASYAKTGDTEDQEPAGRLALVIGNSGYRNVEPLKNPGNDAKLIAETLRGLGFEVVEKTDLTRKSFQAAVDDIAKKAPSYETVLVYYAGHGFQVDGNNYLVPVDSKLRDRKRFANETIDLNGIVSKLEGENRNTLILIDACRNNPVPTDKAATDMPDGLAQMETGSGTFVAFATQPGNITRDGAGDNSPFSIALAEHMQTEGISISDMMIRVRNTVEERTAGEQTPWDQSSLRAQFYFNPTVEATDSLTEEDLALLEQLDPALREKFMKRFGLNLNEDGSAEEGEVVATVTPSLRIEGDFADSEPIEETAEAPAETEQQAETETTLAAADAGEVRSTAQEPAGTPRKPGLMILAMPEEEPAATDQAPALAAVEEEKPEIVALATPEEISPVAQAPAPAPAVPDDATSVPQTAPVSEAEKQAPPPAAELSVPSEPAVSPGNKTEDAPETAVAPAPAPADDGKPAANVPLGETAAAAVAAAAKSLMQRATDTAKIAANSSIPVPAPAEVASAAVPSGDAPVVKPEDEAKAKPEAAAAETAKDTAPAVIASAPQPAAPIPVAPALAATEGAKPETGKTDRAKQAAAPETEIALAKPVLPEAAKPEADTAGQPVAPSLTPSVEPAKTPEPAQVAAAPVDSKPAARDLAGAAKAEAPAAPVATEPVLAAAKPLAEPAKPATAAPETPGVSTQPAGIQSSGPQLTATKPALPTTVAAPAGQNEPAKEQLLAMADPLPETKLAPAATMAAVAPDPAAEPAEGKLAIPLPGDETDEEKKALAIKAQKELTRLGCYRNETDGDWGPRSARALLRFYAEQKLDPDQLEPTAELVQRLTAIDKVICKNTETDRPKQSVKKATSSKPAAKAQPAPAKQKAPVAQKAPAKAKPAAKNAPAVAKAKPAPAKKLDGGALIGAFR